MTIIEASERILSHLPPHLSEQAANALEQQDVRLLTNTRVNALRAGALITDGGEVAADLIVWAAGIKAAEGNARLGLEVNRNNQFVVDDQLRTSTPDVYAIGDCAACTWQDGRLVPARAQAAHQQAVFLVKTLHRLLKNQPAADAKFTYRDFGSLVSLGEDKATGNLLGGWSGKNYFVGGLLAKWMYMSLHLNHHRAGAGHGRHRGARPGAAVATPRGRPRQAALTHAADLPVPSMALRLCVLRRSVVAAAISMMLLAACSGLPSQDGRSVSRALQDTDGTALGQAIRPRVQAHPGLSGIHLLADSNDAFAARMLLAHRAERSLDVQYYIWHNDLTGTLLFEALHQAAERGVRVRLLLDDNNTSGLDGLLAALDSHPNIEVRLFNPFAVRSPRAIGYLTDFFRLNRRMHNKSFTADNQATIVGGRNIGDEYFGAGSGTLFADLDVLAIGPRGGRCVERLRPLLGERFDLPGAAAAAGRRPGRALAQLRQRAAQVEAEPDAAAYVEAVRTSPFVEQLLQRELDLLWAPTRMLSDDPAKGLGDAPARATAHGPSSSSRSARSSAACRSSRRTSCRPSPAPPIWCGWRPKVCRLPC